ncbi:MAG: hypothetical protein ACLVJ8_01570 [Ruthenibacterium lactatiformans]
MLLFLSGLCSTLGISPLLACMALGAGYVNLGGEKRLFKRMDKFSPPFLLLFFALSGLRLNIPSLATAGVIGVAYFFVRIAGKYAGASSGAALCRADPSIIKYLGLAHASGRRFHRSCRAGPTHAACGRRHDVGHHHPFLRCTV